MPEKIDSATITINGKDGWTLLQAEIVEAVSAMGFVHAEVLNDDATIAPASLLSSGRASRVYTARAGAVVFASTNLHVQLRSELRSASGASGRRPARAHPTCRCKSSVRLASSVCKSAAPV